MGYTINASADSSDSEDEYIMKNFVQVVSNGSNGTEGLQQVQVLPVQSSASGQPIMLQQSTPHVIQTADGQTLIYQPVQVTQLLILTYLNHRSGSKFQYQINISDARWYTGCSSAASSHTRRASYTIGQSSCCKYIFGQCSTTSGVSRFHGKIMKKIEFQHFFLHFIGLQLHPLQPQLQIQEIKILL